MVGRLRLLEHDALQPGETGWAQIKLEAPLAAVKGDYYVIRSNRTTLGGGNIVQTHARRHRRRHAPTIERLEVMELGSTQDVLLKTIETSEPCEFRELINRANMDAETVRAELEDMSAENLIMPLGSANIALGSYIFTTGGWNGVVERTQQSLEAYYGQFPLRRGAPKASGFVPRRPSMPPKGAT